MVKMLVYMLGVAIVLNGLTFVYVVTLGPDSETAASTGEGDQGGSRLAVQDPVQGQVERVYRELKSLQTSMSRDLQSVLAEVKALKTQVRGLENKTDQLLLPHEIEEPLPPPNTGAGQFVPSDFPPELEGGQEVPEPRGLEEGGGNGGGSAEG